MPVDHIVEWLAEWGREIRRRQQGLLLLTGHRAKGLEFDHVVVLDGGWDRVGQDEDPDAPRRLYYVAMTRARQTLALARFDSPHPLQDVLREHPSVLHRASTALPPPSAALNYRHVRVNLQDMDLGLAGRRGRYHSMHRAIAALSPGDRLETRITEQGRWELLNTAGSRVGRLAKSFKPPAAMRRCSAEVFAVVGWNREASEPQYRDSIRCDAWEVVVPELVFEPLEGSVHEGDQTGYSLSRVS